MTVEDQILQQLGYDPAEVLAEQQLLDYLRAPTGFTAVELLYVIASIEGGTWTALPLEDLRSMTERAEKTGAARVYEQQRAREARAA